MLISTSIFIFLVIFLSLYFLLSLKISLDSKYLINYPSIFHCIYLFPSTLQPLSISFFIPSTQHLFYSCLICQDRIYSLSNKVQTTSQLLIDYFLLYSFQLIFLFPACLYSLICPLHICFSCLLAHLLNYLCTLCSSLCQITPTQLIRSIWHWHLCWPSCFTQFDLVPK